MKLSSSFFPFSMNLPECWLACAEERGYSLAFLKSSGNKKPIWGGESSTTEPPMHETNFEIKVELSVLVPVSPSFCSTISVADT